MFSIRRCLAHHRHAVRAILHAHISVLCLGLLLSGCSHQGPGGSSRQPSAQSLAYVTEFKKIDQANTGRITMDQATAYYTRIFSELDTAKRGYLGATELSALVPMMGAETPEALLSRLDNKGDGKITLAEFLIIPNWLFQKARSSPTVLTLEDVTAAAKESADSKPGGRHGSGRGRSGGMDVLQRDQP
jgi:hypothetical protein